MLKENPFWLETREEIKNYDQISVNKKCPNPLLWLSKAGQEKNSNLKWNGVVTFRSTYAHAKIILLQYIEDQK